MGPLRLSQSAIADLTSAALETLGYSSNEAAAIARHLVAAEAGGARALGVGRVNPASPQSRVTDSWSRWYPNCEVHQVAGCGHCPME